MHATGPRVLFLLVLLATVPASPRSADAADTSAPAVTEKNLLANERFWPYQVALTRPWQPAGRGQPLRPGIDGVLIRVEASGAVRVDFGRDGLYDVPAGETDLVERANRIRRGELEKLVPNFVLAIGPRLLDSGSAMPRAFPLREVADYRSFLCVFADPDAEDFAGLAKSLAPLRDRPGVSTILFPQGAHPDLEVSERLRAVAWTVPFVYDHLAEAYTRTLIPEKTALPALLLQTAEGRVLFQSGWSANGTAELGSALDQAPPQEAR